VVVGPEVHGWRLSMVNLSVGKWRPVNGYARCRWLAARAKKYALDGGDDEAVQILGTTGDGVRWRWPATVN
jgi:hypothetical protein